MVRNLIPQLRVRARRSTAVLLALAAGSATLLVGPAVPTASAAPMAAAGPTVAGPALAASWAGPLSTRGRYIVDAGGNRFKLKSGNWGGAQGTWTGSGDPGDPANNHSGVVSNGLPLGLDRAPIATILAGIHQLGLNSIRLPFSDQMIHDQSPVPDAAVAANPALRGDTPLQVYDAVVAALTADGFAVILNDHTTTTRWCCGLDGNERWNSGQSTARWEDDWLFMARRYRDNKRVVGADLRNEVRRDTWDDPNWGLGDDHDWYAAAEEAGNRILREADPDLLIIVEGINWTGVPVSFLPHGRPTLTPVATLSHTLVKSDKLVYSAHFYGYTGPNNSGAADGPGSTSDPRYQDFTAAQLADVLYQQAFYVDAETGKHFTAPVWVSEFGVGADETDPKARAWFGNFVDDLIANDTDVAYWPLVGWQRNGQALDSWALLSWDGTGNRIGLLDGGDWRADTWHRLIAASGLTGQPPATPHWNMLDLDHADYDQSLRMLARPDWDTGARKGVCPDGERLIGLSHNGGRALCTDVTSAGLWAPTGEVVVVRDETYVDHSQDWAGGYTKLQCPAGHFAIGYGMRGSATSSLLCARAGTPLGTSGTTVWFDRGDNRPASGAGGEFAYGTYKGQCADGEYIAGIAYTYRSGAPWAGPAALLCRRL